MSDYTFLNKHIFSPDEYQHICVLSLNKLADFFTCLPEDVPVIIMKRFGFIPDKHGIYHISNFYSFYLMDI